jgi:DNA-binding NtrC family response regulator
MTERILIVEDEFIVAHDLKMILSRAGYEIAGIADSVKGALVILEQHEVGLVLLDIFLKGKQTGIDLANILMEKDIPFIYISANSNEKVLEAAKSTSPYGFIVKPYRDKDVLLSIDIARYRKEQVQNLKISSKLFMEDFITDISMKPLHWKKKLLLITGAFQAYLPFDFLTLTGTTVDKTRLSEIAIARTQFSEYDIVSVEQFVKDSRTAPDFYQSVNILTPEMTKDNIYIGNDFEELLDRVPIKKLIAQTYNLKSNLVKSIRLDNGDYITFSFYSRLENIFKREHLDLLTLLENTLAKNLIYIIEFEKVNPLKKDMVTPEKNKLSHLLNKDKFQHIIGQSPALLNLLDQLMIVAPTNTSVLITGESGTGKELIVQNLHRLSARNGKPLIAVNCAALPGDLIESILFGHEKGSFTGAISQSTGKFEEANGGTIFLDEIGEMPFDVQAKLLRVLQKKEIERLGGRNPIPVDLRIIAATNLQLEKEISRGKFRLDLFFRLNVFTLDVPSLRSRKEDIPILIGYFIEKHAKLLGREISGTSSKFLEKMSHYNWPGNIRELEHVVLRAILLSKSSVLHENLLELETKNEATLHQSGIKTILENERDHIIDVLNKCKGKVSGTGGAADLLGIPATTLNSKIKKLGITDKSK